MIANNRIVTLFLDLVTIIKLTFFYTNNKPVGGKVKTDSLFVPPTGFTLYTYL